MKKTLIIIILAFVLLSSSIVFAQENKFYAGVEIGSSRGQIDSSGYNTAGGFQNTGDDHDSDSVVGFHIGKEFHPFRVDLGFSYRNEFNFTTNSFMSLFHYDSEVENHSAMLSVFFEPFYYIKALRSETIIPYIGGGVGIGRTKVSTNDTVVEGEKSSTKFAWQAETGIQFITPKNITFQVGYRYVDLGTIDVHLNPIGLGGSAGNFKAKMSSQDIIFGIGYRF